MTVCVCVFALYVFLRDLNKCMWSEMNFKKKN